jgi:hypothetical protein
MKEGIPEANVEDSCTITYLDTDKTSILKGTKIYLEDTWMEIGSVNVLDYPNTEQGRLI